MPRVGMILIRIAIVVWALALNAALSYTAAQAKLAAASFKLDADYKATLLGLPLGEISWTVELGNNRFTAAATGGLAGLLRIFAGGHGEVAAHGVLSQGRSAASDFALKVITGKWTDEVRIVFKGGKAQEYVAGPPPEAKPNQVPITDADRFGVVDPMTALLIAIPGAGEMAVPEACERTIPIFDGHPRYNLRLAFKATRFDMASSGRSRTPKRAPRSLQIA